MQARKPRGPKPFPIEISERQGHILDQLIRRGTVAHRIVQRAQIIRQSGKGKRNGHISEQLGVSMPTVQKWRERWQAAVEQLSAAEAGGDDKELERQIAMVLSDEPRPGTPSKFSAEQVCQIIAVSCEEPSESGRPINAWTAQELTDEVIKRRIVESISVRQVERFLKRGGSATASRALLAKQQTG